MDIINLRGKPISECLLDSMFKNGNNLREPILECKVDSVCMGGFQDIENCIKNGH